MIPEKDLHTDAVDTNNMNIIMHNTAVCDKWGLNFYDSIS